MNYTPALRLAQAIVLLATAATAQRTWIVDSNPTDAADFRDIPPAVLAASPGDTLLVKTIYGAPYTYSGFTLTKGLSIVAPRRGLIQISSGVIVDGIPADQRVVLQSMRGTTLTIKNCQGPVSLVASGFTASRTAPLVGLEVRNSAVVTLAYSYGQPAQEICGSWWVLAPVMTLAFTF